MKEMKMTPKQMNGNPANYLTAFVSSFVMGAVASMLVDRKSTRLNSSHTVIYTLSLHDALPIYEGNEDDSQANEWQSGQLPYSFCIVVCNGCCGFNVGRSEEHTSELQSHRDLHSFPTRRSSDL